MGRTPQKKTHKRTGSFRTCIGCRRRIPRKSSIRFVCNANKELLPDLRSRLPGRGAHLCRRVACFQQAVHRQAFSRAFKIHIKKVELETLVKCVLHAHIEQMENFGEWDI